MRITHLLIFISLIGAVGLYFYLPQLLEEKKEQKLFETESPRRQTIDQYINATGTLKANDQFTVGSLLAGRVIELHADDNDQVKKDQVLATIDNGVNDTRVKQAKALLDEAQARHTFQEKFYARQRQLFESKQISTNLFEQYTRDYEVSKALVAQRQAELEQDELNYQNLFIKAPDDGIVIARRVEIGQMLTAQLQATVLFEIAHDLTDMEASVDVDEADIGRVASKQEARFTVDAFPKKRFFANVDYIQYLAKTVDNVVTYPTILRIKNDDLSLRPGMTINVDIRVAHQENALALSNKAFRVNGYRLEQLLSKYGYTIIKEKDPAGDHTIIYDYIWVVQDKTVTRKPVRTGARNTTHTEILSKLSENCMVINELYDAKEENVLLKNIFKKPGSIGS